VVLVIRLHDRDERTRIDQNHRWLIVSASAGVSEGVQ
jgi:hypothetical protein